MDGDLIEEVQKLPFIVSILTEKIEAQEGSTTFKRIQRTEEYKKNSDDNRN